MSNSMLVSITIGAALSAGFGAAIGGVDKTLDGLSRTTSQLTAKHVALGKAIKDGLFVRKNVDGLRDSYNRIGAAIDRAASAQKRLNDLVERGAALKAAREKMRSDMMEASATAAAIGAPAVAAVRQASGFQDRLIDIAITGEMSGSEQVALGATMRENAMLFNQSQGAVVEGIGTLVAGGIQNAKELERYTPVLTKTATATRAGMEDLGEVLLTMRNTLYIAADDSEEALNMLAYTGKRGQVEIRDMARFLPQIAPQMEGLGVVGKEAVAEIGAALQIARKGAGTNDEAATNFKNFLAKVTSPDAVKDFAKAGIDLKADLISLRAQGMTPMQGMLKLITDYMGSKSPEAVGQLKKALELKDESERSAALARLGEAYKLGELFQDMQAMNFIRPAIAHAEELASIKQGALGAGTDDLIGRDFKRRMEGFGEQAKVFRVALSDLGIAVGNALLPPLTTFIQMSTPLISMGARLADTFPNVTATVIGLVGGLALGRVALLAFRYGSLLLTGGLVSGQTVIALFTGKLALFRGGMLLATGAVRGFSLSLLANPIGATIAAIAVGALLIYKYWGPISSWFRQAWADVKAEFTKVWPFFEALPGRFRDWGASLLSGLIDGIKAKATAAKEAVIGVGREVTQSFKSVLGIHSPSRVFHEMGGQIGAGMQLGMLGTIPGVRSAGNKLAAATLAGAMAVHGGPSLAAAGQLPSGGGQAMHITYAPVINVQGGDAAETRKQVDQALKLSQVEFEKMLDRARQNRARKGF